LKINPTFEIGINVIHNVGDAIMKGFTNKRLAREKLLTGIFERFEKVNGPVKDFCEKEGIPVSVFSSKVHQSYVLL
jgi:hypothetical protein